MDNHQKISKILRNQLSKIGFEKSAVFYEDTKYSEQFIYLGNYNKKLALVKLYSTKNREKSSNIFREYKITKLIRKYADDKKIPLNIINVLKAGNFEGFNWLIREYIPGKSLGDDAKNHKQSLYLDSYSFINKKFFNVSADILDKIVHEIRLFQEIEFSESEIDELNCCERFNLSKVSDNDVKAISKAIGFDLTKQKKEASLLESFEKHPVLTISDFAPSNILVSEENQIYVSDFEWLCKGNHLLDFSFLWLYLWRYPKWQKDLIERIIRNKNDEKIFLRNITKIIMVIYPAIFSTDKKNQLYISGYKNHIWTRYLQAAGESFEAIIKVK